MSGDGAKPSLFPNYRSTVQAADERIRFGAGRGSWARHLGTVDAWPHFAVGAFTATTLFEELEQVKFAL